MKHRLVMTKIRIWATSSRTERACCRLECGHHIAGLSKRPRREVLAESDTARSQRVLRMRFGIEMNTDHTLEEVGKQFDVTRERIRQIEAKALRKLRHPSRSEQLRSFIDAD